MIEIDSFEVRSATQDDVIDVAASVGVTDDNVSEEGEQDDDLLPIAFDPSPEAVRARCLEKIMEWPIRAIGKRPADWVAHDLLMFNILRDARLSRFHRLLKAP